MPDTHNELLESVNQCIKDAIQSFCTKNNVDPIGADLLKHEIATEDTAQRIFNVIETFLVPDAGAARIRASFAGYSVPEDGKTIKIQIKARNNHENRIALAGFEYDKVDIVGVASTNQNKDDGQTDIEEYLDNASEYVLKTAASLEAHNPGGEDPNE